MLELAARWPPSDHVCQSRIRIRLLCRRRQRWVVCCAFSEPAFPQSRRKAQQFLGRGGPGIAWRGPLGRAMPAGPILVEIQSSAHARLHLSLSLSPRSRSFAMGCLRRSASVRERKCVASDARRWAETMPGTTISAVSWPQSLLAVHRGDAQGGWPEATCARFFIAFRLTCR